MSIVAAQSRGAKLTGTWRSAYQFEANFLQSAHFQQITCHCTQVVYQWARGMPFKDICELTDVLEGSIVRAIVRLDETCREFRDAGKVMGNTALVAQMEAASAAIKRDVIFAASLYVA